MPYVPNPDIQPGNKGGNNQQARENIAHGHAQRIATGRHRSNPHSEDATDDGANYYGAYGFGGGYVNVKISKSGIMGAASDKDLDSKFPNPPTPEPGPTPPSPSEPIYHVSLAGSGSVNGDYYEDGVFGEAAKMSYANDSVPPMYISYGNQAQCWFMGPSKLEMGGNDELYYMSGDNDSTPVSAVWQIGGGSGPIPTVEAI